MIEWKAQKLGAIADMCLGKMLDKEKNKGEPHPYLGNINVRWGGFDLENLNQMRFEADERERYGLQAGDLVICEGGEPGRCALWRGQVPDMKIQKALHRVRVKNSHDAEFVFYRFLLARQTGELKKHFIGSTIKHLTGLGLREVEFEYPPKPIQKRIAGVLSAIDAKIELNNQINDELEAMAKLLYDYWFVQFDFPMTAAQAVSLGRPDLEGHPYKSSGGKMVHNPTLNRHIPEGWEPRNLGDCVVRIIDHRGKTPAKLGGDWSSKPDAITALSAKIVKHGKLIGLENANRVDRELYEKWMPHKLEEGDVLMTSEAPAGECYFILGKTEYCLSQRLFAMRANRSIVQPTYFYQELLTGHAHSEILGSLSGSTVFGIRQDVLRSIKILVPEIEIQKAFEQTVLPLFQQIRTLDFQNQELTQLRDWLLPMLMNGQVTVGA